MDTITHLTLGACIGQAMAGKKIGRPALLLGALAQSIPDTDFIASFWLSPTEGLLAHRGFTHSFLFLILITPLLAWFARKGNRFRVVPLSGWFLFFGLEIFIHLFIDAFNAYGVGWFEPFYHKRISFNTIFVADPLFTIWSLITCVVLLFLKDLRSKKARSWARSGLLFTVLYFVFCLFNKWSIEKDVKISIEHNNLTATEHFSTPTPFNNLLWFVVAKTDSGFYLGHHSVFDHQSLIEMKFYPMHDYLLNETPKQREVADLKKFSQGYYTVERWQDTLVFNDLRFGQIMGWSDPHARFAFHFYLEPDMDNSMVVQRGRFQNWNRETIRAFLRRIRGN